MAGLLFWKKRGFEVQSEEIQRGREVLRFSLKKSREGVSQMEWGSSFHVYKHEKSA